MFSTCIKATIKDKQLLGESFFWGSPFWFLNGNQKEPHHGFCCLFCFFFVPGIPLKPVVLHYFVFLFRGISLTTDTRQHSPALSKLRIGESIAPPWTSGRPPLPWRRHLATGTGASENQNAPLKWPMVQNQLGAPPILVDFILDWDVRLLKV